MFHSILCRASWVFDTRGVKVWNDLSANMRWPPADWTKQVSQRDQCKMVHNPPEPLVLPDQGGRTIAHLLRTWAPAVIAAARSG
eukprot:7026074-Heterocapsa_arctica.AAC.1